MAVAPESFQTYIMNRAPADAVDQQDDYIPILQGGFINKVHPRKLFGTWTSPPFNAANFMARNGVWSVSAQAVQTFCYVINGRTMTVTWYITGTSLEGFAESLQLTIPENYIATRIVYAQCSAINNNQVSDCLATVAPSDPHKINLFRGMDAPPWSSSEIGGISVAGQITFEIQTPV